MPMISTCTDARRRRFRVALQGTQIVLEQVMLVSCSDIVTLNARIADTSDRPHTYYWEQISGTPVTWLEDQDQLMVMWRQPADTGEKVFRFWLDRGTSFEQKQDVLVTSVNRDPYSMPVASSQSTDHQPWLDNQMIAEATLLPMPNPRPDSAGEVFVNPPTRAFSWYPPTNQLYLEGIQVQIWNDGVYTDGPKLTTSQPGVLQYFSNASLSSRYRFNPVFNQFGIKTIVLGKLRVPTRHANQHEMDTFEDSMWRPSLGALSLVTSVTTRTVSEQVIEEVMPMTIGVNHSWSFTKDVTTRTVIEQSAEESYSVPVLGAMSFTRTVAASTGVVVVG